MRATPRQMEDLKPVLESLYTALENRDLPGLLNTFATLIAFVTGWVPASRPDEAGGPLGPSYPPAYDAATALDNIHHGYGYTGLRDGRRLNDDTITAKEKDLAEAVAYFVKRGVPSDMAEYGFMYGLTAFIGARTFGSPDADLAEFIGKSLQTWLDQEWAIRAGGGTPSIGGSRG